MYLLYVTAKLHILPCCNGARSTEMKHVAIAAINRELRLRCNKKSGAVSVGLRQPFSIERASRWESRRLEQRAR